MPRPKGVPGRPQLKAEDLLRIRVLYNDARWGPTQIAKVTGYTHAQVKYALKKKTATVAPRSGRPRKGDTPQKNGASEQEGVADGSMVDEEMEGVDGSVQYEQGGEQGGPAQLVGLAQQVQHVGQAEQAEQSAASTPAQQQSPESTDVEQRLVEHIGAPQQLVQQSAGTAEHAETAARN